MIKAIYGTKLKPTRMFDAAGNSIPVTDIQVEPLKVVQIKTQEKEGYQSVQVGFKWQPLKIKPGKKPVIGHIKKTGQEEMMPRFLREIRSNELNNPSGEAYKVNDEIQVSDVFQVGDTVKVTGIAKAKGFQGGVKRHGFKGGSRTHGQSDRERAPGSIGQTTTPGRVYKGKRMAGHMGGGQITTRGLQIVGIDLEKKVVRVKGLVPGNANSLVLIQKQ